MNCPQTWSNSIQGSMHSGGHSLRCNDEISRTRFFYADIADTTDAKRGSPYRVAGYFMLVASTARTIGFLRLFRVHIHEYPRPIEWKRFDVEDCFKSLRTWVTSIPVVSALANVLETESRSMKQTKLDITDIGRDLHWKHFN